MATSQDHTILCGFQSMHTLLNRRGLVWGCTLLVLSGNVATKISPILINLHWLTEIKSLSSSVQYHAPFCATEMLEDVVHLPKMTAHTCLGWPAHTCLRQPAYTMLSLTSMDTIIQKRKRERAQKPLTVMWTEVEPLWVRQRIQTWMQKISNSWSIRFLRKINLIKTKLTKNEKFSENKQSTDFLTHL